MGDPAQDDVRPDFLQPAFEPAYGAALPLRQRPPKLPAMEASPAKAPDLSLPRAPSPRRTPRVGGTPPPAAVTGGRTPTPPQSGRASPRGQHASPVPGSAPSSAGSAGYGGLSGTASPACGESGKRVEMIEQGYIPSHDFGGIMVLNDALREENKRLRAELVSVQVEHERLCMEEDFLRQQAILAGFEPPPAVETGRLDCNSRCATPCGMTAGRGSL
eukprot:gnl/TRDRNA2_/TRDRNA2_193825_c0_seq1.p1 gnl/TRDRNA2_/TRDRNA2_193825_c0~~gnl/TRDRNA2_/TRDRNA2_193825_c0_seq1.p1  ORF type:complete len:217 (+),score=40.02 gnl/TRDRNA2_/TRDRNA2_193825_c0_seq1:91-741(+)